MVLMTDMAHAQWSPWLTLKASPLSIGQARFTEGRLYEGEASLRAFQPLSVGLRLPVKSGFSIEASLDWHVQRLETSGRLRAGGLLRDSFGLSETRMQGGVRRSYLSARVGVEYGIGRYLSVFAAGAVVYSVMRNDYLSFESERIYVSGYTDRERWDEPVIGGWPSTLVDAGIRWRQPVGKRWHVLAEVRYIREFGTGLDREFFDLWPPGFRGQFVSLSVGAEYRLFRPAEE